MHPSKLLAVSILTLALVSFAAQGIDEAGTPQIAEKPVDVQYPFIAEVTGNDIYVRSGKGTAYYHCSKVYRGDQVTVFEETFGWAKILPPPGCYSWIHKDYVTVEADKPGLGVLKGDNVRVWAGSDYIEAMRSSSMQTKLNEGDIVELLGDQPEGGDYYKVRPPAGAYLWISSSYLKYLGPVQKQKPVIIPARDESHKKPAMPASGETTPPTFKNLQDDPAAAVKSVKPAAGQQTVAPAKAVELTKTVSGESENLKQCFALATKIDQELQKPLKEQNYAGIRKSIEAIKTETTDSKAATYSQILLERIQRYELAISVIDTLKKQDEALARAKEQIAQAHEAQLKELPAEVDFLYSGLLKVSHVYTQKTGQKRYLLQDSNGKIQCYGIPSTDQIAGQLERLIGTKVGIRGTIYNDAKSLVTLVSVSQVESLD